MQDKQEIVRPGQSQIQIKNEYNHLLEQAIDKGMDPDGLEKLVSLAWKQQDRIAAQEFNAAMNTFQDRVPKILKTERTSYATKRGGNVSYTYAPLEQVIKQVRPLLSELGFSFGWDTKVDSGFMTVTCTLRHVNGHEKSATFSTAVDGQDKMSQPQKHASTETFAKRYSFMSVIGVHAEDNDGADPQDVETITQDQISQIDSLISDANANLASFKKFFGVDKIEAIPQSRYKQAVDMLERKINENSRV